MKNKDHVEFKQGLPFYDMVTSFMVSLASSPSIYNKDNPMKLKKEHYMVVEGILLEKRHFYPYDVYELAQQNKISKTTYLKTCCIMLTNTAYESVKDQNDNSPEFEFFRHLRNASSHSNIFNFFDHEPKRPAEWRGNIIDHHLKGKTNSLYGQECFGLFIGMAEIIDLLKDIESKII